MPLCYGAQCGPETMEHCSEEETSQIEALMSSSVGTLIAHLEDMTERRSQVEKEFQVKMAASSGEKLAALLQEKEQKLHDVSGEGSYEILKAVTEYKEKEFEAAKKADL